MNIPAPLEKFKAQFPFYVSTSDVDKAPKLSAAAFKAAYTEIPFARHRELNKHTWSAWWMFRTEEDLRTFTQWAAKL